MIKPILFFIVLLTATYFILDFSFIKAALFSAFMLVVVSLLVFFDNCKRG